MAPHSPNLDRNWRGRHRRRSKVAPPAGRFQPGRRGCAGQHHQRHGILRTSRRPPCRWGNHRFYRRAVVVQAMQQPRADGLDLRVFWTPFNPQSGMIEQTKYDPDGVGGLPAAGAAPPVLSSSATMPSSTGSRRTLGILAGSVGVLPLRQLLPARRTHVSSFQSGDNAVG